MSTAQPTNAPPRLWIWRHIGIRLPDDWEMLQFSSEFTNGRCAFADRYQFRVEMSWRTVNGEPDYDRMVSNYLTKLEQEKKLTGGERARKSGWHGFSGIMNREQTSRFGRYLPETGCLVETVFLWPNERDTALESDILASIHPCPPDPVDGQHWRAFGLDLRVPVAAAFEGATVLPARAEFSFTDPKSGNAWTFTRLGLLPQWFDGDVEKWLVKSLGSHTRDVRITHRRHGQHDVTSAEGSFKPKTIHLRRGTVRAAAWIGPRDGRLYAAQSWIRREGPGTALPPEQMLSPA